MNVANWKAVRSWSVASQKVPVTDRSKGRTCDVLLVITHLTPGGSLEVLDLMAEELRRQGLAVQRVALYRGLAADGAKPHYHILEDSESLDWRGYAKVFVRLVTFIRSTGATAVIGHMPVANVFAALSAVLVGARCRISTHHQPAWAQRGALQVVDRLLGATGAYSHIVAVSEAVETSFQKYPDSYRRLISVIPNVIRPIAPKASRAAVRRRFGIPAPAVLFVTIGRLSPEKNAISTIRAVSRVDNAHLVMVGDGPLRESAAALVAELNVGNRIHLVGHVGKQTAMDLLFASDVFLQLSHYEGQSLALLQAIQARKAIVTSDIASQSEVLRLGDGNSAGLLCDPDDLDAMTAAITRVAKGRKLRRELAARSAMLSSRTDVASWGRDYASLLRL
jgi:glycosyltransferase involved in cell wall biosynthesis